MRSSLYCILLGDDEYSVDYDNFSDNGDDLFNSIVVSLDSYGITIIFVPIKKKKKCCEGEANETNQVGRCDTTHQKR